MLQGVLERGTASSLRALAPYVAGKTGTSDNENDAWFVGFTNDVTIAVWVGYDNADGKRHTLGRGQTGAKVALPIFKTILEAAWTHHAPKTLLSDPSPQVARQLIALPINLDSGDRVTDGGKAFMEYFRLSRSGQLNETQFRLVPQEEAYAFRRPAPWSDGEDLGGIDSSRDGPYAQDPGWLEAPGSLVRAPRRNLGSPWDDDDYADRPRRIDPDYFWGNGRVY
jgi:penicillin-binding protein 1A